MTTPEEAADVLTAYGVETLAGIDDIVSTIALYATVDVDVKDDAVDSILGDGVDIHQTNNGISLNHVGTLLSPDDLRNMGGTTAFQTTACQRTAAYQKGGSYREFIYSDYSQAEREIMHKATHQLLDSVTQEAGASDKPENIKILTQYVYGQVHLGVTTKHGDTDEDYNAVTIQPADSRIPNGLATVKFGPETSVKFDGPIEHNHTFKSKLTVVNDLVVDDNLKLKGILRCDAEGEDNPHMQINGQTGEIMSASMCHSKAFKDMGGSVLASGSLTTTLIYTDTVYASKSLFVKVSVSASGLTDGTAEITNGTITAPTIDVIRNTDHPNARISSSKFVTDAGDVLMSGSLTTKNVSASNTVMATSMSAVVFSAKGDAGDGYTSISCGTTTGKQFETVALSPVTISGSLIKVPEINIPASGTDPLQSWVHDSMTVNKALVTDLRPLKTVIRGAGHLGNVDWNKTAELNAHDRILINASNSSTGKTSEPAMSQHAYCLLSTTNQDAGAKGFRLKGNKLTNKDIDAGETQREYQDTQIETDHFTTVCKAQFGHERAPLAGDKYYNYWPDKTRGTDKNNLVTISEGNVSFVKGDGLYFNGASTDDTAARITNVWNDSNLAILRTELRNIDVYASNVSVSARIDVDPTNGTISGPGFGVTPAGPNGEGITFRTVVSGTSIVCKNLKVKTSASAANLWVETYASAAEMQVALLYTGDSQSKLEGDKFTCGSVSASYALGTDKLNAKNVYVEELVDTSKVEVRDYLKTTKNDDHYVQLIGGKVDMIHGNAVIFEATTIGQTSAAIQNEFTPMDVFEDGVRIQESGTYLRTVIKNMDIECTRGHAHVHSASVTTLVAPTLTATTFWDDSSHTKIQSGSLITTDVMCSNSLTAASGSVSDFTADSVSVNTILTVQGAEGDLYDHVTVKGGKISMASAAHIRFAVADVSREDNPAEAKIAVVRGDADADTGVAIYDKTLMSGVDIDTRWIVAASASAAELYASYAHIGSASMTVLVFEENGGFESYNGSCSMNVGTMENGSLFSSTRVDANVLNAKTVNAKTVNGSLKGDIDFSVPEVTDPDTGVVTPVVPGTIGDGNITCSHIDASTIKCNTLDVTEIIQEVTTVNSTELFIKDATIELGVVETLMDAEDNVNKFWNTGAFAAKTDEIKGRAYTAKSNQFEVSTLYGSYKANDTTDTTEAFGSMSYIFAKEGTDGGTFGEKLTAATVEDADDNGHKATDYFRLSHALMIGDDGGKDLKCNNAHFSGKVTLAPTATLGGGSVNLQRYTADNHLGWMQIEWVPTKGGLAFFRYIPVDHDESSGINFPDTDTAVMVNGADSGFRYKTDLTDNSRYIYKMQAKIAHGAEVFQDEVGFNSLETALAAAAGSTLGKVKIGGVLSPCTEEELV